MAQEHFDRAYTVTTNAETKDLYDAWADTYDADLAGGGYAQPARVAERFIAEGLTAEAAILDIGCGTGLSGVALRSSGFTNIDGCDYSAGMLTVAAETGAYRRVFEADLHSPPIDAATEVYDAAAVVGVFGFAHVEPNALGEMLRPIKRGGLVVIGVNGPYYESGALPAKLDEFVADGRLGPLTAELGDHIPGRGVPGWVISATKR